MRRGAIWLALLAACIFAADKEEAARLPEGEGKPLVGKVCIDCHGAGNFRRARLTPEEWADSVADMVDRGAKGTPEELETIVNYLAKNFGRDSKVQMNTAPLVEIKVVLGFSVAEAQAIVDYRDKNGGLKGAEELASIPGVDAAKIQTARARMAF